MINLSFFRKNIGALGAFLLIGLFIAGCATKDQKPTVAEKPSDASAKAAPSSAEAAKIVSMKSETLPEQYNLRIESDKKIQYSAYRLSNPERVVLELSNTGPGDFKDPLLINAGLVQKAVPVFFPETNITRVEVTLNGPTEYNIDKSKDNVVTLEIKNPPQESPEGSATVAQKETVPEIKKDSAAPPSSPLAAKNNRTPPPASPAAQDAGTGANLHAGEKVSLDFQNADVKNILRLLAEVSGYNIITTPEVQGSVTLRLIDVPWDQALDIVLKNNNLGMEKDGNIIRIATRQQIEAEKSSRLEEQKKLVEERTASNQAEPLATEVVEINYTDIKKLQTNLEGLKSERGKITVDERTNTMILVDIKQNLKKMAELIETLDKAPKQVSIEARIVEISREFSQDLGIQWGGAVGGSTGYNFPSSIGVKGSGDTTPSGTGNYLVNLPAAVGQGAGGGIGMVLGNLAGSKFLDIQLGAMESAGKGKIISNPKIVTKDNVQATISSGTQIPYETVSQEGTQTQLVDATINLTVTPHTTPDGYVSLTISASKNEPSTSTFSASGTPGIETRTIQTEVMVKNGETTVLGGLFETGESESFAGVPWLSKIPGLGWFFKKTSIQSPSKEKELLIFITPKILERM